jgi:sporulation protein YlmC with PRC-barrel domain
VCAGWRSIGQNVFTKDGQKIGDIEDLILGTDNTVDGVVIGAGGFLNVGDKKIGVRYAALKFIVDEEGATPGATGK